MGKRSLPCIFGAVLMALGLPGPAAPQGSGLEVLVTPRIGRFATGSELGPEPGDELWGVSAALRPSLAMGLAVELRTDRFPVSVRGLVEYAPESSLRLFGPAAEETQPNPVRVITGVADLVYRITLPDPLVPYLAAGLGRKQYTMAYAARGEPRWDGTYYGSAPIWPSSYSATAWHLAAGFEVPLGALRATVEYGLYRSRYKVLRGGSLGSWDADDPMADIATMDGFLTAGLTLSSRLAFGDGR